MADDGYFEEEKKEFVVTPLVYCGTCHCWVDSNEATYLGIESGPDLLDHPVYICDDCQDMADMDEDELYHSSDFYG